MTEKKCACPSWSPVECVEIRYQKGWDPEDADILSDEPCECPCHDDLSEHYIALNDAAWEINRVDLPDDDDF